MKLSISEDNTQLKIPNHLAVTMDGNGRWAKKLGKARTQGHEAGTKALKRLVEYSLKYNIKYLTLFSFSTENWARPKDEVNFILRLMDQYLKSDLDRLADNNVKITVIGGRENLAKSVIKLIESAENKTKNNNGLELIIAFNYGGREEIVASCKKISQQVLDGNIAVDEINEDLFSNFLYLPNVPDPDLILRTSGEIRFSNFLIWQAAYSELIFIDDLWPDFDENIFIKVMKEYSLRNRRFGKVEVAT